MLKKHYFFIYFKVAVNGLITVDIALQNFSKSIRQLSMLGKIDSNNPVFCRFIIKENATGK